MQNAGMELRQARERAGLSAQQIADRTKFKLHKIEALENSDFDNLPQGIYLDGIIRAYARELAIDPEPTVQRVRLERGKLPGDSPIPFHEPVEFERPPVAQAATVANDEPARAARSHSSVAFALIALLALLGWGAYFYQATQAADRDRSGKNYRALPAHVAPGSAPIAFTETIVANNLEPERAEPHAEPSGAPTDLTGSWRLATQVESSSYSRYSGLLLGYEIQLEQDGDLVTGIGRKVRENGNGIDSRGQTPIAVSGTIEGDRLSLDFIEGGAKRSTQGEFMLRRDANGMLRGRFSSDAARSAGTVEARRVQ